MTESAPRESVFRPALILMSGRIAGFAAAFVIPIVLARVFSQGEFGTYKQLLLIYATLFPVAQLGMSESLFYFLPASPKQGGRYALNAMLVLGVAGAVCLGVLWAAQSLIAGLLNNPALAEYLPLLGVFLMLMLVAVVLENVMTACKRHTLASACYAVSDLLRASLFIVPALIFGRLEWLLFGAIAFAALRLVTALLYLYREYGGDVAPDVSLARPHLAYAAPFSIYVLIEVLQTNVHLYAVSSRFDAATFAIYAVGCLSIPLVEFLTSSAGNVLMVRMREHLLSGARESVLAVWRDTTNKLVLVYAAMVGGSLVVAHELIVGLYTQTYERSVPIFMIWMLTMFFFALLTDAVLRVYAQLRFLMVLGLVKLVLIGATIYWFMSIFGLAGAVLTMLLTTAVTRVVALVRMKALMRCPLARFLPWGSLALTLALAAAAALPALLVKSVLDAPALLRLLAAGPVYAAVYAALVWRYGPLTDEERRYIVEWTRRRAAGLWRASVRRGHQHV